MKKAAQVISWAFMPILMPIYALLLVMFIPNNQDYFYNEDCLYTLPIQVKGALLYMFGLICVLFPGFAYIIMYRYGIIGSVEMDSQKERSIPIIVMLLCCLALYFLFVSKSSQIHIFSKFIYGLPLSGAFVTAVFFLLNRWKKISIHAGAAGISVGFILAYMLQHVEYQISMLIVVLLISGLVMSARLYLKKHTQLEMWIGWFTGTLITFVINYYY